MPTANRSPFRLVASATLLRRLPLWAYGRARQVGTRPSRPRRPICISSRLTLHLGSSEMGYSRTLLLGPSTPRLCPMRRTRPDDRTAIGGQAPAEGHP